MFSVTFLSSCPACSVLEVLLPLFRSLTWTVIAGGSSPGGCLVVLYQVGRVDEGLSSNSLPQDHLVFVKLCPVSAIPPPLLCKKTCHPSCFNVSAHGDRAKSFLLTTSLNPRQILVRLEMRKTGSLVHFLKTPRWMLQLWTVFQKSFFFCVFFVF